MSATYKEFQKNVVKFEYFNIPKTETNSNNGKRGKIVWLNLEEKWLSDVEVQEFWSRI